jgi:hypothetical protein
MASNMANSDLDESLVAMMEINFTSVGQTITWPVGEDLDLLSSPPTPKESKEEQRKRKERAYDAKRRAANKLPPKNVEVKTCDQLFHDLTLKMLTS